VLLSSAPALRGQSALDGFDPNPNGNVGVFVVQPDGKILIGGNFTTLSPNGGVAITRHRIARLNADGTLDTVFNPNANDSVSQIVVQADGKICRTYTGLVSNQTGQNYDTLVFGDTASSFVELVDGPSPTVADGGTSNSLQ
jgi:Domain of unknown function (DUF5122) beta-propeller